MRCLHRARCTRSGQLNTPTREGCGARSCSARATVMHTGWELPSSGGPRTQGTAAGREAGGGCAPMGRKPWAPGSCSCSKWGELATRGVVLTSPQSPSRTGPRVGPSRRAPMSQAPRSGLGDMGHGNCLSSRPACPQPLSFPAALTALAGSPRAVEAWEPDSLCQLIFRNVSSQRLASVPLGLWAGGTVTCAAFGWADSEWAMACSEYKHTHFMPSSWHPSLCSWALGEGESW